MVRIRLRRTGAKNNPAYRIVVADQRSPRDGAFIDTIGHYLPTRQPHVVEINAEKAREWLLKGAQPSETAASLLRQKGILTLDGKIAEPGAEPEVWPARAAAPVEAPPAAPTLVDETPVAAAPVVDEVPAAEAAPVVDETPATEDASIATDVESNSAATEEIVTSAEAGEAPAAV